MDKYITHQNMKYRNKFRGANPTWNDDYLDTEQRKMNVFEVLKRSHRTSSDACRHDAHSPVIKPLWGRGWVLCFEFPVFNSRQA